MTLKWIVLSYKVPAEPSTLRVRVWRNLKSLGVVYIQQSVCVVPDFPETHKKINQIKKIIDLGEGQTHVLEVRQFSEHTEEQLIQMFNEQRDKEYDEFLGGCNLLLNELESETQKGNFTFHEVEENEADLLKLKRWFRNIEKRDFFRSSNAPLARNQLNNCEVKLAQFTDEVYRSEGKIEGEIFNGDLN
ncbi:Chromate resistance protein ChrB [Paenibacillus popilliae]|uniref:ChrB N-terminal domain-containing protein n=1 Tax=Paenibacillus popilliae TaxID=78057 RepID=A0ABY3AUA4_PAEPP|nr:Chromate resistance protein ChrB [Paenibacillus sp. SDF0028]TQR46407.1 hypothetical protein C7Y44_01620 [Paenibacillus sp. SDF0028]